MCIRDRGRRGRDEREGRNVSGTFSDQCSRLNGAGKNENRAYLNDARGCFTFHVSRLLGAFPVQVIRQAKQRQRIDQPFRGVEVVPLRSVSIVVRIGVVIVVIALAEADE